MSNRDGACQTCGSTEFQMIEGFFYCSNCSTQSQGHREVGSQEDDMHYTSFHGSMRVKKQRSKDDKEKDRPMTPKSGYDHIDEPVEVDDDFFPAVSSVDYPDFLGRPAHRIATFTKLLSRFCDILVRDYDVSPNVRDKALYIWQRYLQIFQVAFHADEITDNEDEQYAPLMKNININADESTVDVGQQPDETGRRDVKREGDLFESLLVEDNENAMDMSQSKHETSIRHFQQRDSCLRTKTMDKARKFPLSVELAQAMAYVASQCVGANWILISDMARWFREGRFQCARPHLNSLTSTAPVDDRHEAYKDFSLHKSALNISFPLDYHVRLVYLMVQIAEIPLNIVSNDFEQILSRFVYNLNLPRAFLHRLHILMQWLPPVNSRCIDTETLQRIAPFNPAWLGYIDGAKENSDIFCFCFKSETWARDYSTGLNTGMHPLLPTANNHEESLTIRRSLSIEVKAVALILMAMKLTFGLDDDRERRLIARRTSTGDGIDKDNSSTSFVFGRWMLQLRLRFASWLGKRPLEFLSKKFYMKADRIPPGEMTRRGNAGETIGLRNEDSAGSGLRCFDFDGCIPSGSNFHPRSYAFLEVFGDDVTPLPTADHIDREALLVPLRYQSVLHADWRLRTDVKTMDANNQAIFFESYRDCAMEYERSAVVTGDPGPVGMDDDTIDKLPSSTDSTSEEMERIFPCSNAYARYDLPNHLRMYTLDTHDNNSNGVILPAFLANESESLFANARAHFALIFEELLEYMALLIGEHQSTVYFQLVLLEYALFDRERLSRLEEEIQKKKYSDMTRWVPLPGRIGGQLCRFGVRNSDNRQEYLLDFQGTVESAEKKKAPVDDEPEEQIEDEEMPSTSSSQENLSNQEEQASDEKKTAKRPTRKRDDIYVFMKTCSMLDPDSRPMPAEAEAHLRAQLENLAMVQSERATEAITTSGGFAEADDD